jgi:predicted MFS family arabinose efflux permease
VIVINLACLVVGIGVGALLGSIIDEYTNLHEGAVVGVIFIMAGLGLYVGYTQTSKALED